jgi:CheY-like chemotaxis protein
MPVNVLVVDDDNEMRVEVAEIMRDEGYHVETAADGLIAKKSIEKKAYALIILDLKMPGLTGYDILDLMREKGIKSKVIVLTGSVLDSDTFEGNGAGEEGKKKSLERADLVMNKPFSINKLIESAAKLTNKK